MNRLMIPATVVATLFLATIGSFCVFKPLVSNNGFSSVTTEVTGSFKGFPSRS
jgi:hypothetical protein